MNSIVGLILPLFGLIAAGYAAARFRAVGAETLGALNFLVYYLALPALFFRLIVEAPELAEGTSAFVITTTFATYCAFAIAFSIGALLNGGRVPEATVEGLAGAHSNIAYLAPAVTLVAFGSAAAVPTALIFSFDNAMLTTLTPLMMALGGTVRANPQKILQEIGRNVFLHPIVIATVLGLIVGNAGLTLPEPANALLTLVGAAAAPGALFALGISLMLRPPGKVTLEMPAIVLVKLVAHPLIVYLLLSWVGGFDPIWVHTAVLLAALPPAMSVLSVAQDYRAYGDHAFTTILLGTVISVVTLTVTVILILNDLLPTDPFR
jgi:malonate transporter and related proteins